MTHRPDFIASDLCLVYVKNNKSFSDVEGFTQIAKIIKISGDWYELKIMNDINGDTLEFPQYLITEEKNIVSNRPRRDIKNRRFFNYTDDTGDLKAKGFAFKGVYVKPLESSSRSALGSGIYGIYLRNDNSAGLLAEGGSVYVIDCPDAYIIQDKEHGDSITLASLYTNRYLDRIISFVRDNEIIDLRSLLKENSVESLTTMWNIVFFRTNENITQEWLEDVLYDYLVSYFDENILLDSINFDEIAELPINDIMRKMGYGGLLGDDNYTNKWGRGCVCYDYRDAKILRGSKALY